MLFEIVLDKLVYYVIQVQDFIFIKIIVNVDNFFKMEAKLALKYVGMVNYSILSVMMVIILMVMDVLLLVRYRMDITAK